MHQKTISKKPISWYNSLLSQILQRRFTRIEQFLPKPIQTLLSEYANIFAMPSELQPIWEHDHAIPLKPDTKPVAPYPYRYPIAHIEEIENIFKEMLEVEVIRKSTSPIASSVLLVRKKDNSWRLVIDYQALNAVIVKNKYPIPVIEELLAELKGSKIFNKLDLGSGYHRIRVSKEDIFKTAFKTHNGHFKFLVMPIGLKNAPASFQTMINEVFVEQIGKFVLVFF